MEPTELSAIAMTRAALVPLHAVLLAADAVQACSNVAISLAASTGFARRHRVQNDLGHGKNHGKKLGLSPWKDGDDVKWGVMFLDPVNLGDDVKTKGPAMKNGD